MSKDRSSNQCEDEEVAPLLKKLPNAAKDMDENFPSCSSSSKMDDHGIEEEFQRLKNKRRQNDFIEQGNKLRRLIRYTLTRAVQLSMATLPSTEEDANGNKRMPQDHRIIWGNLVRDDSNTTDSDVKMLEEPRYHLYAAALAEEKVKECANLQRGLDDAKVWSSSLEEQNKELVRKNEKLTNKLKKTTEALRIAGANAAAARNDANLSHARERKGESDRDTLRALVEEVKRACSQAKEEHNELHSAARQLETRNLQCETEIKTVQMQKHQMQEEKNALQGRVDELENSITRLKAELEESSNKEEKATLMQKEQMGLLFSEKSLRAQADRELEDSRKVISQFTRTVSDQEALVQQLNQVIKDLRDKNSSLNAQLQESFSCLEQLRRETNQQITTLEIEKQKLAMKDTTNKEEIAKIKLDYSALEKQLEQLSKNNLPTTTDRPSDEAALPQKIIDRNVTDSTKSNIAQNSFSTLGRNEEKAPAAEPVKENCSVDTLKSSPFFTKHTSVTATKAPEKNFCSNMVKEQNKSEGSIQQKHGAAAASDCYICSKQPFGIMRMCQCGLSCGKRAHMSCLIGRNAAFCCDPGMEDK